MLYRPEAFEPLTDTPWKEDRVRSAIGDIVADADAAFDPERLWPADEWDAWRAPTPLKSLYVGAAGVVRALDELRQRGVAETRIDLVAAARRTLELAREEPDYSKFTDVPSTARVGVADGRARAAARRVAARAERRARRRAACARARERRQRGDRGHVGGAPGTLIAARRLLESTGEERWAKACRETTDAILAAPRTGRPMDEPPLGQTFKSLTPPHGLVGSLLALQLTDEERILGRMAIVEDGLANWADTSRWRPRRRRRRDPRSVVRRRPGIVWAAASYLDKELLLASAELTWRAGPPGMEKGPCICHGTAGNGHAFLKVFERTGDERWLERARRFAVHVLEQVHRRAAATRCGPAI